MSVAWCITLPNCHFNTHFLSIFKHNLLQKRVTCLATQKVLDSQNNAGTQCSCKGGLLWRDLRRLVGPWPGTAKVILTSHYDAIIRPQFGTERWKMFPALLLLRSGQYNFFKIDFFSVRVYFTHTWMESFNIKSLFRIVPFWHACRDSLMQPLS